MLTAVVVAASLLASGCSDGDGGSSEPAPAPSTRIDDPGVIHVHGIGADPKDGTIFAATHTGLFAIRAGSRDATRVANRYQDTMAFVVTGRGRFLASGHPDGRDNLPPFLGLLESKDAGESWQAISLMGEVDFHLLAVAGRRIYGFGSTYEPRQGVFLASTNFGRTWTRRQAPDELGSLAVHPAHAERLVAAAGSALYTSGDGGRTWRTLPGGPGLLTWPRSNRLYAADARGVVSVSADAGERWQAVGRLPAKPSAFDYADGRLLAALHDGRIVVSTTGGATWRQRYRP